MKKGNCLIVLSLKIKISRNSIQKTKKISLEAFELKRDIDKLNKRLTELSKNPNRL